MIIQPLSRRRFTHIVFDDFGNKLGWFKFEHFNDRVTSMHTTLFPEYIGRGYGRQMYDEAEALLKTMGRVLVPSPSLSHYSLRIWQKRAPHLLKYHTEPSWNGGLEMPNDELYRNLDPTPRCMFWRRSWWYQFKKNYWI